MNPYDRGVATSSSRWGSGMVASLFNDCGTGFTSLSAMVVGLGGCWLLLCQRSEEDSERAKRRKALLGPFSLRTSKGPSRERRNQRRSLNYLSSCFKHTSPERGVNARLHGYIRAFFIFEICLIFRLTAARDLFHHFHHTHRYRGRL